VVRPGEVAVNVREASGVARGEGLRVIDPTSENMALADPSLRGGSYLQVDEAVRRYPHLAEFVEEQRKHYPDCKIDGVGLDGGGKPFAVVNKERGQ
jgi:hypothetical protein